MASSNPQTAAKWAREQALKERRERKPEKKAELAAERAAPEDAPPSEISDDRDSQPPTPAEQSAPV